MINGLPALIGIPEFARALVAYGNCERGHMVSSTKVRIKRGALLLSN